MKNLIRQSSLPLLGVLGAVALIGASPQAIAADKRYTLGSLGPGTTPFLVNTAFAKAVNKYVPGHNIQVSAVGAATKHCVLLSKRRMDFAMGAQTMYRLMAFGLGPFKKVKDGLGRVSGLGGRKMVDHPQQSTQPARLKRYG